MTTRWRHVMWASVLLGTAAGLTACGDSEVRSGDASGTAGSTAAAETTTPDTTPPTDSVPDTTEPAPSSSVVPDTTEPEPPTTPVPPGTAAPDCIAVGDLPPLVVADADGYDTVGSSDGLGSTDSREVVLFSSGGAVATQSGDSADARVEYRIGPQDGIGPAGVIDHALLHDLVLTPSGPAVLYSEIYQGDSEPLAYLVLLDIGTGATTRITESQAPEYFVFRAAVADGVVVTSAYSDLTENISTWALDGSGALERFSPVDPERYGQPPFYGPAVPSPDGTRLAWLEGPDVVGASPTPEGDWQLVVADAFTGAEESRTLLSDAEDQFSWFDWDGRWAVLSRGPGLPAMVVDTASEYPEPERPCTAAGDAILTGTVTIVR